MTLKCPLQKAPARARLRFSGTNYVKALLAMLSALRLVAGSKHAPRAFDSATWQAGASSDRGIHKINLNARKVN